MGLKNIAVLTQYVDNYYCADVIKGIKAYFEDKPVRLFFLETRWEKTEASDYEYQYWSASKLAGTKNIDAVIIITATFCSTYSSEALAELLKTFIHAPIISVAVDLPITNLFYTSADCLSGYRELINHLISKHGCKKIAFVAANKTKSSEAEERLKAYKTVLKENNIDFNPDLIISSDFNQDETINVLRTKYPAKESINFDSVVCVNDYTAFGTIYYLKELGFKIPEDIIVTGYDDCTTAQQMGLTSINQQVYQQGLEAARVALSVAEGKKNPRKTKVAVKTFFRKSCGCCAQKTQPPGSEEFSSTQQFVNFARNYTSFHSLLDKVQGAHTLSHMYNLLSRILIEADIRSFAICLYKTPFFVNKGQDYSLPKKASLTMHYNHSRMEMCVDENIQFNPNDSILPEGIFNEDPCCFIINSIFYGEKQYGYLLYRPGEKEFNLYSVYLKIVSNSIAQAYEYSEKLKENTSLEKKNKVLSINSQTDELTKVFNRRGVMHL